MKLIFLDIDGVMNTCHYNLFQHDKGLEGLENLCPIAMLTLNKIIELTGAKVVISSTWRLSKTIEELQDILDNDGFLGEVVGKTPNIGFSKRGKEIYHHITHQKCTGFVVLEDDVYDCQEVIDHTVEIVHKKKTEHRGLNDSYLTEILSKLSKDVNKNMNN